MGLVDGKLFPRHCDWPRNIFWRERLSAPKRKNSHTAGAGTGGFRRRLLQANLRTDLRTNRFSPCYPFGAGAGTYSAALEGGPARPRRDVDSDLDGEGGRGRCRCSIRRGV